MNFILNLLCLIGLGLGANYLQPNLHLLSRYQGGSEPFNFPEDDTLRIVGIMVEFLEEGTIDIPDNPKTSGNGKFLSDPSGNYIKFIDSQKFRCAGTLVDRPPHDSLYFQRQLEAVGNYYTNISDSLLSYTATIIKDKYYQVSKEMEYYAKGDTLLAEFFTEALDSAKSDIETYFGSEFSPNDVNDVVFVVFHAGLSQDFSYPYLDPTIYDLKSAYIDSAMMKKAIIKGVTPTEIASVPIYTGIILPETYNIIYYDVVEDIYGNPDSGVDDLCAYQYGLTGIFALLLGYELGLPPMFNTDTGDPRVGRFGLMDYGSNNGRGVIPAAPTPWTRIKAGWSNIDTLYTTEPIVIEANDINKKIYKINISENEYFLIENRNNWVSHLEDIDSLRRKYKIDEDQDGYWFDVVTRSNEFIQNDLITIDEITGVITHFANYDYGLPGSGILIWHIIEPDEELYSLGINNNRYNRHVQIEEADGATDIGFECHHWNQYACDLLIKGWNLDYWFNDNYYYLHFGNPYADRVIFDNESNPNTRTTNGAESFLAIEILSGISDSMYISVTFDDGIEIKNLSDKPVHYLGNSVEDDTAFVFYGQGEIIYRYSRLGGSDSVGVFDPEIDKFIFTFEDSVYVTDNQYFYFDELGEGEGYHEYKAPMGYFSYDNEEDTVAISNHSSDSLSFGDIDQDGLDEIVTINENGEISVNNITINEDEEKSVGTLVDGFPVNGDFKGVPLIANILDDSKPEIICREGDDIVIISNGGERLRQLSSFDADQPLAIAPFWDTDSIALIDGSRLFLFKMDLDQSYWLNARSRPSGFPLSTGPKVRTASSPNTTRQKAYNYPNPITEGHTTFRFFIDYGSSVGNVQVRIYDAAGFLLKDDLELQYVDVKENEFNEISWDNIQVDAGLYLAEIKQDVGKSELVRLVVIK